MTVSSLKPRTSCSKPPRDQINQLIKQSGNQSVNKRVNNDISITLHEILFYNSQSLSIKKSINKSKIDQSNGTSKNTQIVLQDISLYQIVIQDILLNTSSRLDQSINQSTGISKGSSTGHLALYLFETKSSNQSINRYIKRQLYRTSCSIPL